MTTDVKDIDGNSYKTVEIGDQIWMAENLKVTHYRNGDPIPNFTDGNDWWDTSDGKMSEAENLRKKTLIEKYGHKFGEAVFEGKIFVGMSIEMVAEAEKRKKYIMLYQSYLDKYGEEDEMMIFKGAYCNYDNDENNIITYGRLYNWYAVNDKRGLAPKGWHIPTDEEWTTLITYLDENANSYVLGIQSYIAGGLLKSKGKLWKDQKKSSSRRSSHRIPFLWRMNSGFTALPGGYRSYPPDSYVGKGSNSPFWSSTAPSYKQNQAWARWLEYAKVFRSHPFKNNGFSVRCVMD